MNTMRPVHLSSVKLRPKHFCSCSVCGTHC